MLLGRLISNTALKKHKFICATFFNVSIVGSQYRIGKIFLLWHIGLSGCFDEIAYLIQFLVM
jgi:hypothetical protein